MQYLTMEAPKAVYELEHYGVPFSRNEEGKIYQRPFGGHMQNYGEGPPVRRTCAAADRLPATPFCIRSMASRCAAMPNSSSNISRST